LPAGCFGRAGEGFSVSFAATVTLSCATGTASFALPLPEGVALAADPDLGALPTVFCPRPRELEDGFFSTGAASTGTATVSGFTTGAVSTFKDAAGALSADGALCPASACTAALFLRPEGAAPAEEDLGEEAFLP
jgi:hypothetical protein